MQEFSGKVVWGAVAGVVMLLIVVFVYWPGGTPDVDSGDDADKIAAIHEIARTRPPEAAETLARVVSSKASLRVRRAAFAGMSHFVRPKGRPPVQKHRPLVEKIAKDRSSDASMRRIAADTLGMYGDRAAAAQLHEIVNKDPEETVRISAIHGLAKCDDANAVITLLDRAENGSTFEIKRAAMISLLGKLRVKMALTRDPKDNKGWRDLIQRWKESRHIRAAFEEAGRLDELHRISRPQDRMGKDWHPERRGRQ